MAYEGMLAETVTITGHNGDLISAYMARPLGPGPYPGVAVIHEVYGPHEHIKDLTRRFAYHGYIAVMPDLHHREGPGEVDDVAAAVRAAGGVPDARFVGDLRGVVQYIKSLPYSNGKVGAIGWCSGGRQALIAACTIPELDAAVDCYGGGMIMTPDQLTERRPVSPIDMVPNLGCPLLGLFGEEDQSPTPAQVAQLEVELAKHGKTYEVHMYPNAGHGFFADYRPSYRVEAANDGWQRVYAWFGKYLS